MARFLDGVDLTASDFSRCLEEDSLIFLNPHDRDDLIMIYLSSACYCSKGVYYESGFFQWPNNLNIP